MSDIVKIMGVSIDKVTMESAVDRVHLFLKGKETKVIYTPNTEIVMVATKDEGLKAILNEADLVIPDGIGLIHASRLKKKPLPERVTGYDLSMKMVELAGKEGYSLFLLGGKEGIANRAGEKLKEENPNLRIAGTHNGYFKGVHIGYIENEEEKKVIQEINDSNADILFVGLGAPKQEKWIHENKDKLRCKVIIGNGGTMDGITGEVKRAPEICQKLGIEWLYRLIKQPSRIKRQMVLPLFALKVLFSKDDIVEYGERKGEK